MSKFILKKETDFIRYTIKTSYTLNSVCRPEDIGGIDTMRCIQGILMMYLHNTIYKYNYIIPTQYNVVY